MPPCFPACLALLPRYQDELEFGKLEDDEWSAEDWDRHEAYDPVLDKGRLLGKVGEEPLFEERVDNPWDKHGAEGLVFYTDAAHWDKEKGDFDQRTADDWNVDFAQRDLEERQLCNTEGL